MEEHTWYAVDGEGDQDAQESSGNDDQQLVYTYVTLMLQAVQIDPWMNIPQILAALVDAGPLWSEHQILELFGGRGTFRQTLQRMEVIRGNAIRGELNGLPITTRPSAGEPLGHAIPEREGFMAWWAPQIGNFGPPFMFSIRRGRGEMLQRYPHMGVYTDEYEEPDGSETEETTEVEL